MKTIEQVEKEIDQLKYLTSKKSIGRNVSFQQSLVLVLETIKPILEFLGNFWLTPKRWKKAIKNILAILESIELETTTTYEA